MSSTPERPYTQLVLPFAKKPPKERWNKIWFNQEMVDKMRLLESQKGYGIAPSGRFKPRAQFGYFDSPWIFVPKTNQREMRCDIWKEVYFEHLSDKRFIPRYCRTICHKVVVVFSSVADLFGWHDVMQDLCEQHDLYGKLGVDRRNYTSADYASFFYCRSMEEGQHVWKLVTDTLLEEKFDVESCILKKGCTEMDAVRPSDTWGEPTADDLAFEEQLNDLFDFTPEQPDDFRQLAWLQNRIKFEWLRFARERGDSTYHLITGGDVEYEKRLFGAYVKTVQYQTTAATTVTAIAVNKEERS